MRESYQQISLFEYQETALIDTSKSKYKKLKQLLKQDNIYSYIKSYLNDDSEEVTISSGGLGYSWVYNQSPKLSNYGIGFTISQKDNKWFYTNAELKAVIKEIEKE